VVSMDSCAGLSGSNCSEPYTSLKCPRTQETIMCRARNSAAVCPDSKTQVAMTNLMRAEPLIGQLALHITAPNLGHPRKFLFGLRLRWGKECAVGLRN